MQKMYPTQKTCLKAKTSQKKRPRRGLRPHSRRHPHLRLSRRWFRSANSEYCFPKTRPSASADRRVFYFQRDKEVGSQLKGLQDPPHSLEVAQKLSRMI